MRSILFLAAMVVPLLLFSQAWSPVMFNYKMNFRHSDSTYITNTLWVDSTSLSSWDTIYHFNRIVRDHPTDPTRVIRNQPGFLKKYMHRQNEESYMFYNPETNSLFLLMPFAGIGDTWLFDPAVPLNAEVLSIEVLEVFGLDDSVKVIGLSDGHEILLSKSFGILQFPDFEKDGYFGLAGIQGTEYGESVPGFWEIFDFEVGDIFQHNGYEGGVGPGYSDHYTLKHTIQSKSVNSQGYEYGVDVIKSGYISTWNGTSNYANNYTGTLAFNTGDPFYGVGKFNNELLEVSDFFCSSDLLGYSAIKVHPDSNGIMTKHYGVHIGEDHGNLYIKEGEGSDTLVQVYIWDCLGIPIGYTYAESLGTTMVYFGSEEEKTKVVLEGYIKNGDTVGVITSDSTLLVGIPGKLVDKDQFRVYPNPASDHIIVERDAASGQEELTLRIAGTLGEQVLERRIDPKKDQVSVSELIPGFYFYGIYRSGILVSAGKLVIR